MFAIEATNLIKRIKGNVILDNISLQLEKGQIHGFYGPNGSGKSMLFRAFTGLIRPTSGEVRLFGKKLGEDMAFPESVGLIIENVGFWKDFTGYENLKMLADIKKQIGPEEIRQAIRRVGLDPDDKKKYGKYSLGMKQRLAIAQAIMEKPELIILDEPTNALDSEGIEQIRQLILEEKERGATVCIASHNREDLKALCDDFYQILPGGHLQKTAGVQDTGGGQS